MVLVRVFCLGLIAFAASFVAMPADPASAAQVSSRQCRALTAEYRRQAQGAGNPSQYQRYADAVRQQTIELNKTRNIYRASGCSRSASRQCRSYLATMNKMQANITRLTNTRNQMRGGSSTAQLRRLKARLDAACAAEPKARTVAVRRTQPRPSLAPTVTPTGDAGTRTVCVRLCDGYFFPVAFHPGPADLANDEARCKAMCPGTETALYMHKLPEEETEAMVSVATGEAYTQLKSAFAYKTEGHLQSRPAECSCRLSGIVDTVSTATTPDGDAQESVEALQIANRPDRFTDAETRFNRLSGLTPGMIDSLKSAADDKSLWTAERQREIRVVGGVFLPLPEAEAGQPVQGPNRARSTRF